MADMVEQHVNEYIVLINSNRYVLKIDQMVKDQYFGKIKTNVFEGNDQVCKIQIVFELVMINSEESLINFKHIFVNEPLKRINLMIKSKRKVLKMLREIY